MSCLSVVLARDIIRLGQGLPLSSQVKGDDSVYRVVLL
jgi:hypothetical protein